MKQPKSKKDFNRGAEMRESLVKGQSKLTTQQVLKSRITLPKIGEKK